MEGALGRAAEYLYILPPWPSSHPLLTLDLSQLGISGELGPVPGQFHCRKFHILVYLLLQFPCPSEMWDALCLTPASCIHSTQPSSTTLCSSLLLPLCMCWKPKLPEKDLQCLSTAPGQNQGEQNQNMTLVYHSTRQLCPLTQSWERPVWVFCNWSKSATLSKKHILSHTCLNEMNTYHSCTFYDRSHVHKFCF